MPLIRLDRYISTAGGLTRSTARKSISDGLVSVDGSVVLDPAKKVDTQLCQIALSGERIIYEEYVYIVLNKPLGYVCSTDDPKSPTVLELIPEHLSRRGLFPAGRLDKYSEGMVIVTNDGTFAHNLLSPKRHLPKRYYVEIDSPRMCEQLQNIFLNGAYLGKGEYASPAELEIISPTSAMVTIYEGIYHQIRRMFDQNGAHVTRLVRVAIGRFSLPADLPQGKARLIDPSELKLLTSN